MGKQIPVVQFEGFRTTRYMDVALANNYIGENVLMVKELSRFIHWYFTGTYISSFKAYYYGEPDERLKAMFGL